MLCCHIFAKVRLCKFMSILATLFRLVCEFVQRRNSASENKYYNLSTVLDLQKAHGCRYK